MCAKTRLVTLLAGLAMLAMPMTALASDHHHGWNNGLARLAVTNPSPRAGFWHGNIANGNSRWAAAHPYAGWNGYSHHDNVWTWNRPNRIWNPPPAYSHVPPPAEYAYMPRPAPSYIAPPPGYYGNAGYPEGYAYGNGYPGSFMTVRDHLLQERAGAYQQLAVRERNGDTNGAHHLWNTIHSLNRQLARVGN